MSKNNSVPIIDPKAVEAAKGAEKPAEASPAVDVPKLTPEELQAAFAALQRERAAEARSKDVIQAVVDKENSVDRSKFWKFNRPVTREMVSENPTYPGTIFVDYK